MPRLDPFALPVRFTAPDAGADGRTRLIEIAHDHVVLRRTLRGMAMKMRLPVTAFLGVTLRMVAAEGLQDDAVVITLEHADPALSVPLYAAAGVEDVVAEWQLWSRVLRRPLLVAEFGGTLREPFPTLGGVRVNAPTPRRRRRNAIKRRRSTQSLRRRNGLEQPTCTIRREREIIARN
jgi:hypothetical protein